jgi:hypothetical protein
MWAETESSGGFCHYAYLTGFKLLKIKKLFTKRKDKYIIN